MYILGAHNQICSYIYYAFASFFSFYKSRNFLSRKEKFAYIRKLTFFFTKKRLSMGKDILL